MTELYCSTQASSNLLSQRMLRYSETICFSVSPIKGVMLWPYTKVVVIFVLF